MHTLMQNPKPKVLLYGEGTRAGSGAWCYVESLRDMGHEVEVYSERMALGQLRKSFLARIGRKLSGITWEPRRKEHVGGLLSQVERFRPEIVIILKGLHIDREAVQAMRKLGSWVVNINHDDFFSQNRNNRSSIQRKAIPAYDRIFATREVNVAEVRLLNPNVEFFPFAYYPKIHKVVPIPIAQRKEWESDVVFVGTWERARAGLLDQLISKVPARYAIFGSQWETTKLNSPLRKAFRGGEVALEQMAMALGGAKIALGFLRKENRDDYTQRTFEIPACGGMLLGERTSRQQSWFKEGIEAEYFDPESPQQLCDKVRSLLEESGKREQIREAGRRALLRQKHTYCDRLEHLLAVFAERR